MTGTRNKIWTRTFENEEFCLLYSASRNEKGEVFSENFLQPKNYAGYKGQAYHQTVFLSIRFYNHHRFYLVRLVLWKILYSVKQLKLCFITYTTRKVLKTKFLCSIFILITFLIFNCNVKCSNVSWKSISSFRIKLSCEQFKWYLYDVLLMFEKLMKYQSNLSSKWSNSNSSWFWILITIRIFTIDKPLIS